MWLKMDESALDDYRIALMAKRIKGSYGDALLVCLRIWRRLYQRGGGIMSHDEIDAVANAGIEGVGQIMADCDLADTVQDGVRIRGEARAQKFTSYRESQSEKGRKRHSGNGDDISQPGADQRLADGKPPAQPVLYLSSLSSSGSGGQVELVDTKPPVPRFDFESLYAIYPRKEGKKPGLTKLEKDVRTQADYDLLASTVRGYIAREQSKGTELKFYKHWGTFANQWRGISEELEAERTSVRNTPTLPIFRKTADIPSNWAEFYNLPAREDGYLSRGETPPWWAVEKRWNMAADKFGFALIPVRNGRRADAS